MRRCLVINPDDRLTLAEATALTFVLMNENEAAEEARTGKEDPWSHGFADSNDPNVKSAIDQKILICDDELKQKFCTVPPKYATGDAKKACLVYDAEQYEKVNEKIHAAGVLMQRELQSWRVARTVPLGPSPTEQERSAAAKVRDAVDKPMKEVCKLRCEKTWTQLVDVAPWLKRAEQ